MKKTPVVAVVTKCDAASPERVAEQLVAVSALGDWADVVPVSAVTGFNLDVLADVLVSHLPEGVPLYPDGELTDEPEQIMVAELIREAALDGVRDELPHSIAVVVEEMGPRPGRDDLTDVHAELYVERSSQKAIVIGDRGSAAEGGGQPGPPPDRGAPRHEGLPRPARQDRQGLAAQPAAAPPPGVLRLSRCLPFQPAVPGGNGSAGRPGCRDSRIWYPVTNKVKMTTPENVSAAPAAAPAAALRGRGGGPQGGREHGCQRSHVHARLDAQYRLSRPGDDRAGWDVSGYHGQLRVGPRCQRLADPGIELIFGQPALNECGLERADHLVAVDVGCPQAARRSWPLVCRPCGHEFLLADSVNRA